MAAIPLLGQHVLIKRAMEGDAASFLAYFGAAASVIVCGLICVAVTTRLFRREKIIFGR